MKWDAWGDPAAAKPLSDGVRSLLKQVVGLADSEQPELDPAQVQLRPSALSGADHDALARIVGTEYFRTADRDRLLHAGGKSTPDLLRRKDTGVQDAPDAVLLPGGPNGGGRRRRHLALLLRPRHCRGPVWWRHQRRWWA
ncbi:flavoprotein [Mycobacterium tuberculosis TRS1]|nr:flavoprotein [Mycobacterium tuberculosis CCDC5180]AQN86964.1 flavoprotein [Mycobacterium tuberculosis 1821ADB35]AQN90855.1 flavoprotein [Mycobacterium tuberculosis 1821ADB37]AQN94742.1 flavoprotein [Mycobacterium tuberculosis 1821ADB38]AQN98632.1 flavoprotein [Mycobacterium tuberculosis 1821ADB41]AQO02512.1 flavoprotein [Mycobacterium tuberculosis 1821ADB42]AQO06379.1 flavoprotein [Mycobacterium tuberculosis 1821ADB44]AQO10291.1 flavoprotein [Mycobacterium tuberculosis TRS1]AQO14183.1 fl